MNWFTKSHVSTISLEKKQSLVEEWGGCEHVISDPSSLYTVSYENDSFGREGWCSCEACEHANEDKEGEEEVMCSDCKGTFKKKDTTEWRWYDFYAAQGDEALVLCETCRRAEKHVERKRRDAEDCEEELNRPYCSRF